MSERSDYSAPDQVCALNFKESVATAAPVSEVVGRVVPDYAGMFGQARAAKKRAKNRNRQQRCRARPRETSIAKLASALRKATTRPRSKQLEQLRDRVEELASFCFLSRIVVARHGPMSDADLARHLTLHLDGSFTRKKAWQLRQIVASLQADGGPWHNI